MRHFANLLLLTLTVVMATVPSLANPLHVNVDVAKEHAKSDKEETHLKNGPRKFAIDSEHDFIYSSHHTNGKPGILPSHAEIDAMYPTQVYTDAADPHLVHTVHNYDHVVGYTSYHEERHKSLNREFYVRKRSHTVHDTTKHRFLQLPSEGEVRLYDNEGGADPRVERYLVLNGGSDLNKELKITMAAAADKGGHNSPTLILTSLNQIDREGNFFMRAIVAAEPHTPASLRAREYTVDLETHARQGRYYLAPEAAVVDPNNATMWLLRTRHVSYHNIFMHADIDYDTNFLPGTPVDAATLKAIEEEMELIPDSNGPDFTENDDDVDAAAADNHEHAMKAQGWGWFRRAFRAVRRSVRRVVSAVRRVARAVVRTVRSVTRQVVAAARTIGRVIVKTATRIVNTVIKIAKGIINALLGNVDIDEKLALVDLNQNLNADGKLISYQFDNNVIQAGAGYKLEIGFKLIVKVTHFSLKRIRATFYGIAKAAAQVIISTGTASYEKLLATIKLPTIRFTVGPVPVIIKCSVPITLKVTADVELSSGTWQAGAYAAASIEMGMEYTGSMHMINQRSFTFTKSIDPIPESATVTVRPAVVLTLLTNIQYIGGPFVTLDIGVPNTITYDTTSQECLIKYQLGMDIAVGAGAELRIEIEGIKLYGPLTWGPFNLFTISQPIFSFCSGPPPQPAVPELPASSGSGSSGSGSGAASAERHSMRALSTFNSQTGKKKAANTQVKTISTPRFGGVRHETFHPQATAGTAFTESEIGVPFIGRLIYNGSSACNATPLNTYTMTIANITADYVDFVVVYSSKVSENFAVMQSLYRMTFTGVPGAVADFVLTRVADPEIDFSDTSTAPGQPYGDSADLDPEDFEGFKIVNVNGTVIGSLGSGSAEVNSSSGSGVGITTTAAAGSSGSGITTTAAAGSSGSAAFPSTPLPTGSDAGSYGGPPAEVLVFPTTLLGQISAGRRRMAIYDPNGCGIYLLRTNETCSSIDCQEQPERASAPPLVSQWSRFNPSAPAHPSTTYSGNSVFGSWGEALDINTGASIWSKQDIVSDSVITPVLFGTNVIFATPSGVLLALNQVSGSIVWKRQCGTSWAVPPKVVKALGLALLPCGTDFVVLNMNDGAQVTAIAGAASAASFSLICYTGATSLNTMTVYFGLTNGQLTSIAGGSWSQKWQVTLASVPTLSAFRSPISNVVFLGATNDVLGLYETNGTIAFNFSQGTGPAVSSLQRFPTGLLFSQGASINFATWTQINNSDATNPLWYDYLVDDVASAPLVGPNSSWIAFAVQSGRVYLYTMPSANATGEPELQWSFDCAGQITAPLFRRRNKLMVTAEESLIGLDLADGFPWFRYTTGVAGSRIVYTMATPKGFMVTSSTGELHNVYKPASAQLTNDQSFFQFDPQFTDRVVLESQFQPSVVYMGSATGLLALSIHDGSESWRSDAAANSTLFAGCFAEFTNPAVKGSSFIIASEPDVNNTVLVFNGTDGSVLSAIYMPFAVTACTTSPINPTTVIVAGPDGFGSISNGVLNWTKLFADGNGNMACTGKIFPPIVGNDYIVIAGATCLQGYDSLGNGVWEPDFVEPELSLHIKFAPTLITDYGGDDFLALSTLNMIVFIDLVTGASVAEFASPTILRVKPMWMFDADNLVGYMVYTSRGGLVQSVDPENTGAVYWSQELGDEVVKTAWSPLDNGAAIVVILCDTVMYGLDASSGTIVWTLPAATGQTFVDVAVTLFAQAAVVSSTGTLLLDISTGKIFGRINDASVQQVLVQSNIYLLGRSGVSAYPTNYFPPVVVVTPPPGVATKPPVNKNITTDMGIALAGDWTSLVAGRRAANTNVSKTIASLLKSVKDDLAKMLGVAPQRINISGYSITNGKMNVNFTISGAVDVAVAQQQAAANTAWLSSTRKTMAQDGLGTSLAVVGVQAAVNQSGQVLVFTTAAPTKPTTAQPGATKETILAIVLPVCLGTIAIVVIALVVAHHVRASQLAAAAAANQSSNIMMQNVASTPRSNINTNNGGLQLAQPDSHEPAVSQTTQDSQV